MVRFIRLHALFGALLAGSSLALAQTEPTLTYTVRPTDKLIRFSRDMLVRPQAWPEVARLNQLRNPNLIFPGQQLRIPLRLLKPQAATAKVLSVEGDVKVGEQPAAGGTALAEGGKVQTGANSSAVIELGDGSRVKLLPNTLLEVASNRTYAMRDASASGSTTWFSGLIRLAQGAVETVAAKIANRATPLQIETPTSLVGVRGTEFRVAYDDPATRSARAEVMEGLVRADNTVQASGADLPGGTGAVIDPTKKTVEAVRLLPAPDVSALPAEVFRPEASWPMPSLAVATAYRVQIASDAQFDRIARDIKVAGATVDLSSLALGNWFARVRGIDNIGLEGLDATRPLSIKEMLQWRVINSSLTLIDGRTVLDFSASPAGSTAALGATGFSAELAQDSRFAAVLARPQATATRLVLGDLKPGTYYIRLQAQGLGPNAASETYRFELPGNWGSTVFGVNFPLERATQ